MLINPEYFFCIQVVALCYDGHEISIHFPDRHPTPDKTHIYSGLSLTDSFHEDSGNVLPCPLLLRGCI